MRLCRGLPTPWIEWISVDWVQTEFKLLLQKLLKLHEIARKIDSVKERTTMTNQPWQMGCCLEGKICLNYLTSNLGVSVAKTDVLKFTNKIEDDLNNQ